MGELRRRAFSAAAASLIAPAAACSVAFSVQDFTGAAPPDAGASVTDASDAVAIEDAPREQDARRPSYRDEVLVDQPAAYWRFDERTGDRAKDERGGPAATFQAVTLGVPGAVGDGTAVRFEAAESAVIVGDLEVVGDRFSLEAWVRPTLVDGQDRRIFCKLVPTTPVDGWNLTHDATKHLQLSAYRAGKWTGGLTPASLPRDVYTHLVVTFDGTTLRFYVDGQRVAQFVTAIDSAATGARFVIGSLSSAEGAGWRGDIDEPAVYNHALEPDRVLRHFEVGRAR